MARTSLKFFGLLARKERWGLSSRGWLLLVVVGVVAAWGLVRTIHPFLAVTHRVPARILVVEGWVDQFGITGAVVEFKRGHYTMVCTTGGPLEGRGASSSVYDTSAYQTAVSLEKSGIPAGYVQIVPAHFVGRDRTYTSAVVLGNWLREYKLQGAGINILTEDVHARRTWLLFREALGAGVKVGIIAVPNPDYDASHWWRYSEGVRQVINESIAYIYARFLFHPAPTR
jgi:hypothetical protein